MKIVAKVAAWLFGLLFREWKKPHEGEMVGGGKTTRDDVNGSVDDMLDDDTKIVTRRTTRPGNQGDEG